jgi:hypothetical protein
LNISVDRFSLKATGSKINNFDSRFIHFFQ